MSGRWAPCHSPRPRLRRQDGPVAPAPRGGARHLLRPHPRQQVDGLEEAGSAHLLPVMPAVLDDPNPLRAPTLRELPHREHLEASRRRIPHLNLRQWPSCRAPPQSNTPRARAARQRPRYQGTVDCRAAPAHPDTVRGQPREGLPPGPRASGRLGTRTPGLHSLRPRESLFMRLEPPNQRRWEEPFSASVEQKGERTDGARHGCGHTLHDEVSSYPRWAGRRDSSPRLRSLLMLSLDAMMTTSALCGAMRLSYGVLPPNAAARPPARAAPAARGAPGRPRLVRAAPLVVPAVRAQRGGPARAGQPRRHHRLRGAPLLLLLRAPCPAR